MPIRIRRPGVRTELAQRSRAAPSGHLPFRSSQVCYATLSLCSASYAGPSIHCYASEERFMEPAIEVAIGALIISFFGLIATLINSVVTAKTYRRNRRLEFLQRRDRLSQQISDLNDRNTEFQLISARYELVAVKNTALPLRGEQAERNMAVVASIRALREVVETEIGRWVANIERLHFIYSNLTLETDAPEVEKLITIVQVASDDLKKATIFYSANVHILETTNELIKTTLAEADEKIRQIDLDFEKAWRKLRNKS